MSMCIQQPSSFFTRFPTVFFSGCCVEWNVMNNEFQSTINFALSNNKHHKFILLCNLFVQSFYKEFPSAFSI